MSFRRDKQQALRWQTWLEKNRVELVACGIPVTVLEESARWYYFLDHGYFTPADSAVAIINVDSMCKANAERLCSILERDDLYPGSSALHRLRYLPKRK